MFEDLMNAKARQFRNKSLYTTLDQAAGLPFQQAPEPVMTGGGSPADKQKNRTFWLLVLGAGALLLFGKAFKKGLKKL